MIIIVKPLNDPPEFTSTPIQEAVVGSIYYYDVNATDVDEGDILQYSLMKKPDKMEIDTITGQITWVPSQGQEGEHEIVVGVFDPHISVFQNFTITVHPHLVVTIINPTEGKEVSGKMVASGTAQGPEGVTVEVNLDGEGWRTVDGNGSWKYNINTWDLSNGNHTIKVMATWGDYKSENATVTFLVDNPVETKEEDNGWMMWIVILLLFIMALVLLASGMRGKKAEKESPIDEALDEEWTKMDDREE